MSITTKNEKKRRQLEAWEEYEENRPRAGRRSEEGVGDRLSQRESLYHKKEKRGEKEINSSLSRSRTFKERGVSPSVKRGPLKKQVGLRKRRIAKRHRRYYR